jgi:hypothetical protein
MMRRTGTGTETERGSLLGFGDGWGSIGPGEEQRGSGSGVKKKRSEGALSSVGPGTSATRTSKAADGRRTPWSPVGN